MPNIEKAAMTSAPLLASGATDEFIIDVLGTAGYDRGVSEQVLAFLPLACGRIFLQGLGITFSDDYGALQNGETVMKPLAGNAVYQIVEAYVRRRHREGAPFFPKVAMRSSEVDAVNQALNAGANPADLVCGPPMLLREWAEVEIEAPEPAAKKWWEFWRR
jgi:hypothetical protein